MFPYVPPFGLSLIYLSLLKAKTEAKEENGWEEEQNALSSWKEVMIQISPFHDSSSLGCSQSRAAFAMFLMMITPFQQLTIFKDPPPSSFSLCVHYDQHYK